MKSLNCTLFPKFGWRSGLLRTWHGRPVLTADESAVTADGDAAVVPSKKRRRSGGPARAAREAAFLASKAYAATENPCT